MPATVSEKNRRFAHWDGVRLRRTPYRRRSWVNGYSIALAALTSAALGISMSMRARKEAKGARDRSVALGWAPAAHPGALAFPQRLLEGHELVVNLLLARIVQRVGDMAPE